MQEEDGDGLKRRDVRAIDDRAALSFGHDKIGSRQHGKMGGQRVLRHFKQSSEIASGQSIGLVLHQYPEGLEPSLLGEGAKRQDSLFVFHISRFMEISEIVNSCRRNRADSISNILELWFDFHPVASHASAMKLTDAASRLEALGNPTRLRIYRTLVRAGQSGMPVGRLQEKLKVAPSTLSHHVKSLVSVGLIRQDRGGTTLVCHAEYDTMRGLVDFLVAECCADEVASGCNAAKTAA